VIVRRIWKFTIRWYIEGKLPWEYEDNALITLCRKHHQEEHKRVPLKSFFLKEFIPKKSRSKKPKKSTPIRRASKKKNAKLLKGRDKKLQERYNRLKKQGKLR
jgi:hypothetical protein